ncbi:MAG: asparagine synthase (glutamine-hydrolyzing) [Casimicrobium sp.]
MCGIVGFIRSKAAGGGALELTVAQMANAIARRGPDDSGEWSRLDAGIAFGHRRLSIVDLSPAGHQPMHSATSRFVIVFNGEIYNHEQMRAELVAAGVAPQWRGHSDTETLLAAFEHWGIEPTLQKTIGMFAIALWDQRDRRLYLARDRFGEKPLYYGWVGRGDDRAFVFGSELKALRAYPGFDNAVCRQALAQYMRFVYVPAPRSIYQGIYKLEPGCLLTVVERASGAPPSEPLRAGSTHEGVSVTRWWSLGDAVVAGAANQITDEREAVDSLEATLSDAVRLQSLADVPLGAFLSGGVDSSAIVALMQRQATQPVKTFTIGFEEKAYDESDYARAVAHHLGTLHSELYVTADEARDVIKCLPTMYDEPFADSSQIPTHLVCRAARQHVTVALSGDAGDELFGGYNRYFWGPRIWERLAWLPYPARRALGAAITAVPTRGWDALGAPLNALLPGSSGIARVGDKAHKLAARLRGVQSIDDLYRSLVSEWQDPASVVLDENGGNVIEPHSVLDDALPSVGLDDGQLRMMYRDSLSYLPDDILCKVDRAAMATSLETRVPFLDHRVAELAWRMPLNMKIRGNQGKWALRQVLYRHVPRELIERPKAGFGIPVGEWLRGPLREWAESLLAEPRLRAEGYFRPEVVTRRWREHVSGARDHTLSIWSVLMFQAWLSSVQTERVS